MDIAPIGRAYYDTPQISPDMMAKIDNEVKKILDVGYQTALSVLKKTRKKLDAVSLELVKKETLEGDEFERLMGGARAAVLPHPANP